MDQALAAVKQFHEKFNQAKCRLKLDPHGPLAYKFQAAGLALLKLSKEVLMGDSGDPIEKRGHLMLEELGETLLGISKNSEVETLDGLADQIYVVAGTALCFDLPLAEVFFEVHRSNMTKSVISKVTDPRMRTKGPFYEPPQVGEILAAYRTKQINMIEEM